jgi:hypothetical protein
LEGLFSSPDTADCQVPSQHMIIFLGIDVGS